MSKHLFRISGAAWEAATKDEVFATCAALKEADLYALPYAVVDVEVPVDEAVVWTGPNARRDAMGHVTTLYNEDGSIRGFRSHFGASVALRVRGVSLDPNAPPPEADIVDYKIKKVTPFRDPKSPLSDEERVAALAKSMERLLIALLSTRNAVKETSQNKLAKLGIGKKNPAAKYEYVTTISPPAVRDMEDDPEHPPAEGERRASPCPHLRRAHWKDVRFGPGRSYVKRMLIHATYVLADKEWTKTRVAYNVSL